MKILHIVGGSKKGGAFKGAYILHKTLQTLNIDSQIINDEIIKEEILKNNIDTSISTINNTFVAEIGKRKSDVWDDEPEGVYAPTGLDVNFVALSDTVEVFIAGAKCDEVYDPFVISGSDIDFVQYGSDETKTHRKIKHILGQKQNGKVGRLLVSELYTVGQGGWSGFPPLKHDTARKPTETQHD